MPSRRLIALYAIYVDRYTRAPAHFPRMRTRRRATHTRARTRVRARSAFVDNHRLCHAMLLILLLSSMLYATDAARICASPPLLPGSMRLPNIMTMRARRAYVVCLP